MFYIRNSIVCPGSVAFVISNRGTFKEVNLFSVINQCRLVKRLFEHLILFPSPLENDLRS